MTTKTNEQWRPIPGWPGYYVSDRGRVRSMKVHYTSAFGCILKHLKGPQGYPQVNLHNNGRRRTIAVHRLVARAFLGPRPEGMQVRHLDGQVGNPALSNLAYGTPSQNYEDARAHGTYTHGSRHGKATITEDAVRRMRQLRVAGMKLVELARMFGQSTTNISDICNRKTWTHV